MMRFPRTLYSAILALQSILAFLQLLDTFQVWYYPMIHGYAYSLRFDLGFSLAPILLVLSSIVLVDLLMKKRYRWVLVSFAVSVGLYPFFGFQASVACLSILLVSVFLISFRRFGDFVFCVLVLLTGFEGLALVHWLFLPFGFVSPLVWLADLELALFYVFAPLAPLMVVFIIFIVVLKLLSNRYLEIVGQYFRSHLNLPVIEKERIVLHPWFFLASSLVFAVVAALYPYSPHINPEGLAFGVDVHYYLEWMAPLEKDLLSAFTVANGSRPIMLYLIYGFQHGLGLGVLEAIKHLPVLLNPLLVLSVFLMVLHATEDGEWAGLASLFSSLGFTMTVGLYSYYITNILGLALLFFTIGFLFKTIRTGNKVYLALASVLGSLSVFTHPWTFTQYYAGTAIFLVYIYFREKRVNESRIIFIYLSLTGLVDILKVVIGGLEVYGVITTTPPNFIELAKFWRNNIIAFRQTYGGLLSNTVLLGFATFGVYLLDRNRLYHLFLTLFIGVSLVYYLNVDGFAQTKILYNMPISVLAALGILFIVRSNTLDRRKKIIVLLYTGIYMMVYLLRSLANLL